MTRLFFIENILNNTLNKEIIIQFEANFKYKDLINNYL